MDGSGLHGLEPILTAGYGDNTGTKLVEQQGNALANAGRCARNDKALLCCE
jgi:hypothetical protein